MHPPFEPSADLWPILLKFPAIPGPSLHVPLAALLLLLHLKLVASAVDPRPLIWCHLGSVALPGLAGAKLHMMYGCMGVTQKTQRVREKMPVCVCVFRVGADTHQMQHCLDDIMPASQPTVECKSNASVACLCTRCVYGACPRKV